MRIAFCRGVVAVRVVYFLRRPQSLAKAGTKGVMGRGEKASHHSLLAPLDCCFSLLPTEPWERLWWRRQVYFTFYL